MQASTVKYKGYNSCVAKDFLEHIQVDITYFTKNAEENDGFRYGLAGVDVFARYGWLVPMKTTQPHDVISALKKLLELLVCQNLFLVIWRVYSTN